MSIVCDDNYDMDVQWTPSFKHKQKNRLSKCIAKLVYICSIYAYVGRGEFKVDRYPNEKNKRASMISCSVAISFTFEGTFQGRAAHTQCVINQSDLPLMYPYITRTLLQTHSSDLLLLLPHPPAHKGEFVFSPSLYLSWEKINCPQPGGNLYMSLSLSHTTYNTIKDSIKYINPLILFEINQNIACLYLWYFNFNCQDKMN